MRQNALPKAAYCTVKGHLSQRKTRPFRNTLCASGLPALRFQPRSSAVSRRRKAFAAYLREYENGLLEDFHLIPERVEVSSTISQNMTDPVSRAYHRFNTRRNLKILSEFKAEMRTWNPHGLFASNPALHRGTWEALRGIDIFPLLQLHDIIYIENRFFAGTVNGALVGNYRGFLEAEPC